MRTSFVASLLRLLTWYEGAAIPRGVVLRVPGGAGAAMDAALLAALAMIRRETV